MVRSEWRKRRERALTEDRYREKKNKGKQSKTRRKMSLWGKIRGEIEKKTRK